MLRVPKLWDVLMLLLHVYIDSSNFESSNEHIFFIIEFFFFEQILIIRSGVRSQNGQFC